MIKSANLAFPNECFKWNQIMSWSPGQHKRKIRKGNPGLLGKYFVIINLLISEGTCVIFLKNSSAAISFEWDQCTCPMSTSRTFKMKITDLPGCWRLWRDPQAQWGWGRQTEALRKDVHFGQCYCRICLRLCEIKIKGAYVVCAETCSRRDLILVIQFPLRFRFSSPQLWQRGSSSVWVLNWVHLQPEENSFYWEQCGSKGEKCRTPSEHQVSVEIMAASSKDFPCPWRTAIKSFHYFDSIHVGIKQTIPQRCLFLSFIGKLE